MVRSNKKLSVHESTSEGVLRTTRGSQAKRRKTDSEKQQKIARSSSLPMDRSNSHTSHESGSTITDREEEEDESLELNVTAEDRMVIRKNTPRKEDFVKDPNIGGVKGRIGWTPKRFDDKWTSGNRNRHGNKFRERHLRHDFVSMSDMGLITHLNRNTSLYDISEDTLTQMRSITLKCVNNLERIYRKLRRGDRYSHFPSIYRNIQRNFRI
jgi:hypothetical protein